MQEYLNNIKIYYARNRKAWRQWLIKNHTKEKAVWIVRYKKQTGKPCVSYEEIAEEALCFGWIDGKAYKLDEERSAIYVTERKPKSLWSKINKRRIEDLIEQGLMTDAGMEKITLAKANGSWNTLNVIDEMIIPADLKKALTKNKTAQKYFNAFAPSSKKIILYWIQSAKQPETRTKRIEQTVSLAAQNIKANHYNIKSK